MAYSDTLQSVLNSLQERRKMSAEPNSWARGGQALLEAQMPEFENPWVGLAASFGKGFLGGAMADYGRARQMEALAAQEAKDNAVLTAAFQEKDPVVRSEILSRGGLSGIANIINMGGMYSDLERQEKMQDPAFIETQAQNKFMRDMKEKEYKLNAGEFQWKKDQLAKNMTAAIKKADEEKKEAEEKAIADSLKITQKGAEAVRKIVLDAQRIPEYRTFADANSKYKRMVSMIKLAEDAQASGDPDTFAAALHKTTEDFVKIANEALQADDTRRFAESAGMFQQLELLQQRLAGQGGLITLDQAKSLTDTMGQIRAQTLAIAQEATAPQRAMIEETVRLYEGTSDDPWKQLFKSAIEFESEKLRQTSKDKKRKGSKTETKGGAVLPATPTGKPKINKEMSNTKRLQDMANFIAEEVYNLFVGPE